MAKTAAQIAQAWQQGMAGKGANYAAGIANCNVNPMALAAAQADTAVANYANAKERMVAGLNATSVQFWKQQAQNAQAKWQQGSTKGMPKYTAKMAKLVANVYPGMKAASMAAGGKGGAAAAAAIDYLIQAKQNGQT
jgi:hypothetical protein